MGGKEGTEWGNNERDEGNSKTTQMVVQIELEYKTAIEVDRIEVENKSAANEMERTHRSLLVSQIKSTGGGEAFQSRGPGRNRVNSASQCWKLSCSGGECHCLKRSGCQ